MLNHVDFEAGELEGKKYHVIHKSNHVVAIAENQNMAGWRDSWISGILLVVCVSLTPCVGDGGSCLELGFSSNLLCSSCRELKEFSLSALVNDCKKCCHADGVASDDKVCG